MLLYIIKYLSVLRLSNVSLFAYTTFSLSIHPSTFMFFFHILTIGDNAIKNTTVQMDLQDHGDFSDGPVAKTPGSQWPRLDLWSGH